MRKIHNKNNNSLHYGIASLRIGLGLIFLWAFIDKLWGLGYSTCRNPQTGNVNIMCEQAWLSGGSPTEGFLQFASTGPFEDIFQGLVGVALVDWLFMAGLLLIGVGLLLGIGIKLSTFSGSVMMLLMWLAVLPPPHHPFMDDHIIYILAFAVIYLANADQKLGFGSSWAQERLVKKHKWLQ